jgi:hypothetical protein
MMSATLINFIQYSELPTKIELENKINEFDYNFKFISEFEKFDNLNKIDSIKCELNGQQTFVKMHQNFATEIISNLPYLKEELQHKDFGISFVFSSDNTVCTSLHIISLGLAELCQSIVLHTDEKKFYTKEMLIKNISNSLKYNEEEVYKELNNTFSTKLKSDEKKEKRNENIKIFILWGILFLVTLCTQKGIISWTIPTVLFFLIFTTHQIYAQKIKNHNK